MTDSPPATPAPPARPLTIDDIVPRRVRTDDVSRIVGELRDRLADRPHGATTD